MSYTLLSETKPKAAKNHICIWCGQSIVIGERYRREKSVFDGQVQDHAWHLECDIAFKNGFVSGGEEYFCACENDRPQERLGFANASAMAPATLESESTRDVMAGCPSASC